MKYVYLLRSIPFPAQRYVGITSDLRTRLNDHNHRRSAHTSKFAPWDLVGYTAFRDERRAIAFERYLKSGAGRAFANRHLW